MENQFWAVGCGMGWTVGKKGLGRLWATFEARFFTFSRSKIFFNCTEKLHWKKVKKIFFLEFFFFRKTIYFRAKNATVCTLRSGTDYCWLYCDARSLIQSVSVLNFLNFRHSNFSRYFFIQLLHVMTRPSFLLGACKMHWRKKTMIA